MLWRAAFFIIFWAVTTAVMIAVEAFETTYYFTRDYEDLELDEIVLVLFSALLSGSIWLAVEVYLKSARLRDAVEAQLEAEQELNLTKRYMALGTLAGGLAHSGNNLLQPILTLTRISLKQLEPGDPVRPHLEQVVDVANQAAALFRKVDRFSKEHAEPAGAVDLAAFISEHEDLFALSVPKQILFTLDIGCEEARVGLDRAEMTDLVLILLSNAADSFEGGTGEVRLGLHIDGTRAILTVSDTGCGIEAGDLDRVFDPFFTTKPPGAGTGLGLHGARTMMQRAGGTINVASTHGHGTTFTLNFPLRDAPASGLSLPEV